MPRDPVLGTTYGPPKVGKTTDLAYAFPRAIWIAAPGATAPAASVCGYELVKKPHDVPDLDTAIAILEAGARQAASGKKLEIDAVIVDDLTSTSTARFARSRRRGSDSETT